MNYKVIKMKVKELLFEGPYEIDQDWVPTWKSDTFISDSAIERDYQHLGRLEGKIDFDFWLRKSKGVAIVTMKAKNDIGDLRNKLVVDLHFQKGPGLPIKDELQVSTVITHEDFRARNLTSALYIVLCRYGYTVVSDFTQYQGGKSLWKNLEKH